jgi:hypothetical protein
MCVCVCNHNQTCKQNIKCAENKEYKYFGDKLETLCTKEKNHAGTAKPRKFIIKKK